LSRKSFHASRIDKALHLCWLISNECCSLILCSKHFARNIRATDWLRIAHFFSNSMRFRRLYLAICKRIKRLRTSVALFSLSLNWPSSILANSMRTLDCICVADLTSSLTCLLCLVAKTLLHCVWILVAARVSLAVETLPYLLYCFWVWHAARHVKSWCWPQHME
jgi:hypothetical protein